jgi:hypothetical protein
MQRRRDAADYRRAKRAGGMGSGRDGAWIGGRGRRHHLALGALGVGLGLEPVGFSFVPLEVQFLRPQRQLGLLLLLVVLGLLNVGLALLELLPELLELAVGPLQRLLHLLGSAAGCAFGSWCCWLTALSASATSSASGMSKVLTTSGMSTAADCGTARISSTRMVFSSSRSEA